VAQFDRNRWRHHSEIARIEVYVANTEFQYSNESIWFAYQLQNHFKDQLGFESRGVKFANFQVLRETADYCPSVLIELGFLSNVDDSNYLNKQVSFQTLALVVLESINKNYIDYERASE
jgi:N-acetylmuramoyl-L-alanine amidase